MSDKLFPIFSTILVKLIETKYSWEAFNNPDGDVCGFTIYKPDISTIVDIETILIEQKAEWLHWTLIYDPKNLEYTVSFYGAMEE